MTEYTVDKDGNVKSKGKGKKPLPTRYMEGDIPFTIPSIAKKIKGYKAGGSVSRGQYPMQTQKVKFKGVF